MTYAAGFSEMSVHIRLHGVTFFSRSASTISLGYPSDFPVWPQQYATICKQMTRRQQTLWFLSFCLSLSPLSLSRSPLSLSLNARQYDLT